MVSAAFGAATILGVGWLAGGTWGEAMTACLAFLGLAVVCLTFNRWAGWISELPFSDAAKGTIAIVTVLAAILLLVPPAPPRPTYQQASSVARDQADHLAYADVAGRTECTEDCSGHEVGFEWAKENGVEQSWDCPTSGSRSYREGCEAYTLHVSGAIAEMR